MAGSGPPRELPALFHSHEGRPSLVARSLLSLFCLPCFALPALPCAVLVSFLSLPRSWVRRARPNGSRILCAELILGHPPRPDGFNILMSDCEIFRRRFNGLEDGQPYRRSELNCNQRTIGTYLVVGRTPQQYVLDRTRISPYLHRLSASLIPRTHANGDVHTAHHLVQYPL